MCVCTRGKRRESKDAGGSGFTALIVLLEPLKAHESLQHILYMCSNRCVPIREIHSFDSSASIKVLRKEKGWKTSTVQTKIKAQTTDFKCHLRLTTLFLFFVHKVPNLK